MEAMAKEAKDVREELINNIKSMKKEKQTADEKIKTLTQQNNLLLEYISDKTLARKMVKSAVYFELVVE